MTAQDLYNCTQVLLSRQDQKINFTRKLVSLRLVIILQAVLQGTDLYMALVCNFL